jgi:hypothetical protein
MARYTAALGITQATTTNYGTTLPLPQDYADMTGWPDLVDTVAAVFHALPDAEQSDAVIFGINYGRTGAIALLGPAHGLPYPISRHGDFFTWGPGDRPGKVVIVVGGSQQDWEDVWDEVEVVAHVRNRWGVDEEQDVTIYVCRRPTVNLQELFRELGPEWG